MESSALQRLATLRRLNRARTWVNKDLYRLLYREDLYVEAFGRIRRKPGIVDESEGAPGSSRFQAGVQTLIGTLKDESFQFTPYVKVETSNVRGKRTDHPPLMELLVQEAMCMLLEAVYENPEEPFFLATGFGYGPKRNSHAALEVFRRNWSDVNWIIKGDVGFGDLEHRIVVDMLRKKIADERFLSLCWKYLGAGYMAELQETISSSLIEASDLGILSPLLANIVMHQIDAYTDTRRRQMMNTGEEAGSDEIGVRHGAERMGSDQNGEPLEFVQCDLGVRYIRYAHTWLIGVRGPRRLAEVVEADVNAFLREQLELPSDTRIYHAKSEQVDFLACRLTLQSGTAKRGAIPGNKAGHHDSDFVKTRILIPVEHLLRELRLRGFCNAQGMPSHKGAWIGLPAEQIVRMFDRMNRGIQTYYRFADNFSSLRRIEYILRGSMAKTMAAKYKTSVKQIYRKYGPNVTVKIRQAGQRDRKVSFHRNRNWEIRPMAFRTRDDKVDLVLLGTRENRKS